MILGQAAKTTKIIKLPKKNRANLLQNTQKYNFDKFNHDGNFEICV